MMKKESRICRDEMADWRRKMGQSPVS